MQQLRRQSAPASALIVKAPPSLGIVHIGLGNFHRAHFAVQTAEAVAADGGEWGIYAYSLRSNSSALQLASQDFLYTVVDIHPESSKVIIPGIHVGASGGPDSLEEVHNYLQDKRVRIISLTITESGYCYSTETGGLDLTRPEIIHDLKNLTRPQSAIGLLARALIERAHREDAPVTLLSCDNLTSNGSTLKRVLSEFAQNLNSVDSERLLDFMDRFCSFPNSMVDRIVPGTEERHRNLVEERLGVRDEIPVPAEKFSMWVMEDSFIAGRPAWEKAGVIFSDEVEKFETMKLRLLNGSHSLLAYLGALAGKESVPQSRFTQFIEEAVRKFMKTEMAPTLTMPRGFDLDDYIEELFSRWSNTVLSDKLARIGSDGSIKLPPRMTESTLWHSERNQSTPMTALVIAAWLACICPPQSFAPGPTAQAMKDPAMDYLATLRSDGASARQIVERLFSQGRIFSPKLNSLGELKDTTAHYLEVITSQGIERATRQAISS